MTFRTRLILLSVGQVAAMVTLAVLGVYNINKISARSNQAVEQVVDVALNEKAPELNRTHENIELLLNADRDAYQALKGERDASEAADLEAWESGRADFVENAKQVRDRVTQAGVALPDSALALQSEVLAMQADWAATAEQVIAAFRPGSDAALRAKGQTLRHQSQERFAAMRDGIDQLVGIQEENVQALSSAFKVLRDDAGLAAKEVNETATFARWKFAVIAAVVSVVLVIAAMLIVLSITRGLNDVVARLREIATGDGDLTRRVNADRRDELGQLGKAFNVFVEKVHDLVAAVGGASTEVAQASTQIGLCMGQMAKAMQAEQTRAQQISAAAEEMNASVAQVAMKAKEATASSANAGEVARDGGEVVSQTVTDIQMISDAVKEASSGIEGLLRRSEQIGEVVNVINEIADQTNLLALNAAIEAARAGEHGRGFAVVADEVRKLADRTTTATDEIAQSIGAIQKETADAMDRMNRGRERVESGVGRAAKAGDALQSIVATSTDVSQIIRAIAASSREQAEASEEVSRAITEISTGMDRVADGSNDSTQAINQLSNKAEQLQALISKFKLLAQDRRKMQVGELPPDIASRRQDPRDLSMELMRKNGLTPPPKA